MFFKNSRIVSRIKFILGWTGGGVFKRLDENRELLELLQDKAPGFLGRYPRITQWLRANDEFLTELSEAVRSPHEEYRFHPVRSSTPSHPFPRLWPDAPPDGVRHASFSSIGESFAHFVEDLVVARNHALGDFERAAVMEAVREAWALHGIGLSLMHVANFLLDQVDGRLQDLGAVIRDLSNDELQNLARANQAAIDFAATQARERAAQFLELYRRGDAAALNREFPRFAVAPA